MKNLQIGVLCFSSYGGSGVLATELGLALGDKGHKIYFVSSDVPKRLDRFGRNNILFYGADTES